MLTLGYAPFAIPPLMGYQKPINFNNCKGKGKKVQIQMLNLYLWSSTVDLKTALPGLVHTVRRVADAGCYDRRG